MISSDAPDVASIASLPLLLWKMWTAGRRAKCVVSVDEIWQPGNVPDSLKSEEEVDARLASGA
jgi:hypothetical protein